MREEIHGFLHREGAPNGAVLVTVEDIETGEVLFRFWERPQRQRRGGKSRYCIGDSFDTLTGPQRNALLGMRSLILNDGSIRTRRKKKSSRHEELAELLGKSMLSSLIKAGAIYEQKERFFVSRSFLFRG